MEKTYKTVYEITGRTNAQNYACSGWYSEEKNAIETFIKKYPRFKGKAVLQRKQVEDIGNGVLVSDSDFPVENLCVFTSKTDTELLQYINGKYRLQI